MTPMRASLRMRVERGFLALAAVPLAWWGIAAAGCGDSEETRASGPAGGTSSADGSASGGSSGLAGASASGGSSGLAGASGSGTADGSGGAGGANRWDGGIQPKTLLQAGDGIVLRGITSDGYVIYFSESDSTLRAIPYWGGPSEVIHPGSPPTTIRGRAVFIAPPPSSNDPFTVWMNGMKPLPIPGGPSRSNASYSIDRAAITDPDGKRIVFTRDVGGVLHWIGANVDLTNEVDLMVAGLPLWAHVDYAAGHFVTTSGVSGDGGGSTQYIDSWDASFKRTAHYAGDRLNLTYDGVQVAGNRIIYREGVILKWATPGSSAAMTIADSAYEFVSSADGDWVGYYDYGNGSFVSSVTELAPVTLGFTLGEGGSSHAVFSPNNAYIAVSGTIAGSRYASVANGTAIELTSGADLLDGGFTSDSRYVLHAAEGVGIQATPVDGGPAILIAPLGNYTHPYLAAALGARVVYVKHDTAQLAVRDLDSAAEPTVLSEGTAYNVSNRNPFDMTADRASVVYVVNAGDEQHGLYAIGIP
jgi:hypothetical protein